MVQHYLQAKKNSEPALFSRRFLGVPRVYEKIMEKLLELGKLVPAPIKAVSDYAKSINGPAVQSRQVRTLVRTEVFLMSCTQISVWNRLPRIKDSSINKINM